MLLQNELANLHPTFGIWTVDQFLVLKAHGRIKLNPGFQRNSVWSVGDRRKLIESILQGYPLPSIFLYRREEGGNPIYEVIDGKQRLETILMFVKAKGFRNSSFDLRVDLGDGLDWQDWNSIKRYYPLQQSHFSSFKLQTVEVTGSLRTIVDLFVRINSTGKSLTSGEKRNAKFYTSSFLKEANRLLRAHHSFFVQQKILSQGQLDRMKGVELISELLISIDSGGVINKKISLDRTIGNEKINANTLKRLSSELVKTLNLLKKIFPKLSETRLKNSAEFYSLFMLVWEMDKEKFVLSDKQRNLKAFALLRKLAADVDQLRQNLRELKAPQSELQVVQDYVLTVQGDTDSSATRERRRKILKGILWSIFERKDDKRIFSLEQRRILWNSDAEKKCPRCGHDLHWDDLSVDHVVAYSRGGKTSRANAQLMHKSCNSSKGSR